MPTNKNIILIILILFAVMLFGGFFLCRYLNSEKMHNPEMTVVVKFKEVPPVIQDFLRTKVRIFYRGFPVGQVSKITLSCDKKCIDFYLDFYYKELKLPKNTQFFLNSEDIYGARHFIVRYPEKPSPEVLKDGDLVYGTGYEERIDKYLVQQLETGELGHLVSNLNLLTDLLTGFTGNIKGNATGFAANLGKTNDEVQQILKEIREILEDPAVKKDIKSTLHSSSKTLENVNRLIGTKEIKELIAQSPDLITKTVNNLDSVNKNLSETNKILPQVDKTVSTTNCVVSGTNCLVTETNSKLAQTNCNLDEINKKVPAIPPDLLPNADIAVKKANCFMDELSKILSKRFLGLRLVFGNPAKSLKKCGTCPANR